MATGQAEKEKELYQEVSRTVTSALPGVEVLAVGERSFQLQDGTGKPVDIPYDSIVRANLIDEG